jgi:hypothetical protein
MPKSKDKDPAIDNPIKATDCGIFRIMDPTILGSDIIKIHMIRISSTRATANGPNRTGGVR